MNPTRQGALGGAPQEIPSYRANSSPSRVRAEALAERLREHWPHLFAEPLRPLAVGIRERIEAALGLDDAGRRALRDTLGHHTRRTSYLEAVIEGRERIALDGSGAGIPEARHIEHAREELARKVARHGANGQAAVDKAARIAAAALLAQTKAQRKAAASLPAVPKPAPRPEPQARLLVERKAPVVIIKKRRVIVKGGAPCA